MAEGAECYEEERARFSAKKKHKNIRKGLISLRISNLTNSQKRHRYKSSPKSSTDGVTLCLPLSPDLIPEFYLRKRSYIHVLSLSLLLLVRKCCARERLSIAHTTLKYYLCFPKPAKGAPRLAPTNARARNGGRRLEKVP